MKKTISVTEAARNFAECVNRAHYQKVTFVLVKNGRAVARLVPPEPDKVGLGCDLAEVLGQVDLPVDEARAWRRDLQKGRKTLKTPADKWQ